MCSAINRRPREVVVSPVVVMGKIEMGVKALA